MRMAGRWLLAAVLAAPGLSAEPPSVRTPLAGFEKTGTAADRDLLESVMSEGRVERSLPAPSWNAYATDLSVALGRAFSRGVGPLFRWLGSQGLAFKWLAWGLVAVLVLTLVILLGRFLRRPRARPVLARTREEAPETVRPAERDHHAWRAEIERRLRDGDVTGALAALWWWLARSLTGGDIDAAWTTRELIERSGRRDLSALGRALDRMVYGPARPASADIRLLVERLEAMLS